MNTLSILTTITETYNVFKQHAEGMGKDPESLKDFMESIEIFLIKKESEYEKEVKNNAK